MRYVVMMAYPDGTRQGRVSTWEQATESERQGYYDAHDAFEQAVNARGSLVSGVALAGAGTATTLRHGNGDVIVSEGPFAETVEQIGGFYVAEMPDLDAMIEAAALLPPAYVVEIRPVVSIGEQESS